MHKHALACAAGLLLTMSSGVQATEIRALISTAMKTSIEVLTPQFARATGHKLNVTYSPSGPLTKRIADGEAADFVIIGGEGIDTLTKQGKVVAGSGIARGLIGAAVAKGAPKPDISTPEKFRAVLIAAKSVAYTDAAGGGASGVFLGKLFDRIGLTEVLKPKAKLADGGPNGYAGTFVARGEAEIALQPIPD